MLLKPDRLTEEEFTLMKKHCGFGKRILRQCSDDEEMQLRSHSEVGAQILDGAASPLLVHGPQDRAQPSRMVGRLRLPARPARRGHPAGRPHHGRRRRVRRPQLEALLQGRRCPWTSASRSWSASAARTSTPTVFDAFLRRRNDVVAVQLRYADEE